jgi:hypothetical protein
LAHIAASSVRDSRPPASVMPGGAHSEVNLEFNLEVKINAEVTVI